MMIAGTASQAHGFTFTDPAQMAADIGAFMGSGMRTVILLMMGNDGGAQLAVAGTQGARILPVYLACVAAAAGIGLIPRAPPQLTILGVEVLAGVMLPPAIISCSFC